MMASRVARRSRPTACRLQALGHRVRHSSAITIKADKVDDQPTGVKVITLNRPEKLNPMTVEMGNAITAAVDELVLLPPSELKAVVLTGAGRAFSAGGDLHFLQDRHNDTPTNNAEVMMAFYKRYLSIRRCGVIVAPRPRHSRDSRAQQIFSFPPQPVSARDTL